MRLLLAAALVAVPAFAHAATYEFHTTSNGHKTTSTTVLAPKALCVTTSGMSGAANGGKMIFVDNPPVIFYERAGKVERMDQARIEQMKQQLQAVTGGSPDIRKAMEAALAKVPPAQREIMRKQMEKSMGAMMPNKNGKPHERKFAATGKTKTVNGYKTTEYMITDENGKKVGTAMLTPVSALPDGKALMGRIDSMLNLVKGLMSQFGMNGVTGNFMNLPKGLFPVAGKDFGEDGKVTQEMMLAKATSATPSDCKAPE